MDLKKFYECTITEILILNHNVKEFTVEYPLKENSFVTSSFVFISDGTTFRPYTPVKVYGDTIKFAIKIYEKGTISKYLGERNVNDKILISPVMHKKKYTPNEFNTILMIAGGTGITPMIQVLEEINNNNKDKTKVILMFSNKTESDIFLENIINKYNFVELIKIFSRTKNSGLYSGRINLAMVEEVCKNKKIDFVYVCGPPGFMETVSGDKTIIKKQGELDGILKKLNFTSENVFKF